jgi:hypothetical protein
MASMARARSLQSDGHHIRERKKVRMGNRHSGDHHQKHDCRPEPGEQTPHSLLISKSSWCPFYFPVGLSVYLYFSFHQSECFNFDSRQRSS